MIINSVSLHFSGAQVEPPTAYLDNRASFGMNGGPAIDRESVVPEELSAFLMAGGQTKIMWTP